MRASFAPRLTTTPMLEAERKASPFCTGPEIVNGRISDRPVSRRGLVLRSHSQSKLVGLMEHLVSSAVQSARVLTIRSRRGRTQGFCDPSLDLERRRARYGPGFLFPSLQDRLRDIVAPSPSALGRVARAHPIAAIVKKLAGKERV